MAKNKTIETTNSISGFINSVENEQQRNDSIRLIEMMQDISGCEPRLWGASIIGFGSYHYKYASGHEGDAPLIGFSPRKSATSLYVYSNPEASEHLLQKLGKYKMGKACIYIKKISDIDEQILKQIARNTIAFLTKRYSINNK
jgi:hypothetical protein